MNATITTRNDGDQPYAAIRETAEKMRELGAAGRWAGRQIAGHLPFLARVYTGVQIEVAR